MHAKELQARRIALGLTREEFGEVVGAGGQAVAQWELGRKVPREPQQVEGVLSALETHQDALVDLMEREARTGQPLPVYLTDEACWEDYPEAAAAAVPARVYNTAAVRAARAARRAGVEVTLTPRE